MKSQFRIYNFTCWVLLLVVERAEPLHLIPWVDAHVIAPSADEGHIASCRWLGLLAHAVDEARWSFPTFITKVCVIDTPIPLRDILQHVASTRLVGTAFIAAVAVVTPVFRKIAARNLALATFW